MKCPAHLCLEALELAPSAEWSPAFAGWCVLGVVAGQGYWIGEAGPRALGAGDMATLSPLREGIFRASQIGPVTLKFFRFSPELLDGLLTPTEREKFHKLALQPRYAASILAADTQAARAFSAIAHLAGNGNALLARTELARIGESNWKRARTWTSFIATCGTGASAATFPTSRRRPRSRKPNMKTSCPTSKTFPAGGRELRARSPPLCYF